jgi:hypothetical protein
MITCPRHGVLLHGTQCVGCDCPNADAESRPAFVRNAIAGAKVPAMGFDLASRPDMTARVKAQKIGGTFHYSADELDEALGPGLASHIERMAREQADFVRRYRDRVARSMRVPPEHFNCRSTIWESARDARPRSSHWGGAPHRKAVEIISDPADPRGMDARRVGPA